LTKIISGRYSPDDGLAGTGVFIGEGRNNTVDFHQSDVGYVPQLIGHYIENVGKDTLRLLEVFTTLNMPIFLWRHG
jgi:oxalate decarboxylase/phosphoglucose isomerase-like protein (cupin superfamily)